MKTPQVARVQRKDTFWRKPELIQTRGKAKAVGQRPKALKLSESLPSRLSSGGAS